MGEEVVIIGGGPAGLTAGDGATAAIYAEKFITE